MSVCLTKTEIIAGSVDGTVRTFDIRIGRYVLFLRMLWHFVVFEFAVIRAIEHAIKLSCFLSTIL